MKHREVNGRSPTNLRCASLPGFRPGKIVEARQLAEVEAKPGHGFWSASLSRLTGKEVPFE
jgi:hypothetical protein